MKVEDIEPGTRLSPNQAKQLGRMLGEIASVVRSRRRGILLIHDSLQGTIGIFLQMHGWEVEYEVPFHRGEWDAERVVFDIVASQGKKLVVVEVKDEVTHQGLGQILGYANTLQLSKMEAKLYLGTDILNYGTLVGGVIGETVKKLMEREGLGVILADKYLLMTCDNYPQLVLEEMPAFVPSEEPIG